jgi:hypothetical protein
MRSQVIESSSNQIYAYRAFMEQQSLRFDGKRAKLEAVGYLFTIKILQRKQQRHWWLDDHEKSPTSNLWNVI